MFVEVSFLYINNYRFFVVKIFGCANYACSLKSLGFLQKYHSKGICATASTAQDGDHLSVHYTGRFDNENGKIFDTSHNSGQLYKFQLGARQVS